LLPIQDARFLANANTPEERQQFSNQ